MEPEDPTHTERATHARNRIIDMLGRAHLSAEFVAFNDVGNGTLDGGQIGRVGDLAAHDGRSIDQLIARASHAVTVLGDCSRPNRPTYKYRRNRGEGALCLGWGEACYMMPTGIGALWASIPAGGLLGFGP